MPATTTMLATSRHKPIGNAAHSELARSSVWSPVLGRWLAVVAVVAQLAIPIAVRAPSLAGPPIGQTTGKTAMCPMHRGAQACDCPSAATAHGVRTCGMRRTPATPRTRNPIPRAAGCPTLRALAPKRGHSKVAASAAPATSDPLHLPATPPPRPLLVRAV